MKKRANKRIISIGFALFLSFMGICTLIAKGIYAAELPRVKLTEPKRISLSKDITFTATVQSGNIYGIYETPGLRLTCLYVKDGQPFEAGDPLYSIDTQDLEDIIAQMQLSIDTMAARVKEIGIAREAAVKESNVQLTRAQEDSTRTERDTRLLVNRQRERYEDAQQELSDYITEIPDVSAGDATIKQQKEALEDALREAAWALEDALLAQTDEEVESKWALEDASSVLSGYSAEDTTNRLQMKRQQEQLERLQVLLDQEGEVYAQEAGTVQEITMAVGDRTTDGACLYYYRTDDNQILEATLSKEDAENIALGNTQTLRLLRNDNSYLETKEAIDYRQSDGNGQVVLRWYLDTADNKIGQSVSVYHPSQTLVYDTCIPNESLYQDPTAGTYIYTAEQREGILGTQWVARRIYVTVVDKDQNMSAIKSASIGQDTQIITRYDKPVTDGAPLRIME